MTEPLSPSTASALPLPLTSLHQTPVAAQAQTWDGLAAFLGDLPSLWSSNNGAQTGQAAALLLQYRDALAAANFHAAAQLLQAMHTVLLESPGTPAQAAQDALQLAAQDVLAHLQCNETGSTSATQLSEDLFPAYRAVCKLSGKDTAHPADLWEQTWQLQAAPSPLPDAMQVRECNFNPATRAQLDQHVLAVVKSADPTAASRLRDLCLGLALGRSAEAETAFWQVAAGCFDATAHGLLEQNVYTKRLASRVLMHYANAAKQPDTATPAPENLVRDLLYYCTQAAANGYILLDELPQVLQAVCRSYCLIKADSVTSQSNEPMATMASNDASGTVEWSAEQDPELHTPLAISENLHASEHDLDLSHLDFGEAPLSPAEPLPTAPSTTIDTPCEQITDEAKEAQTACNSLGATPSIEAATNTWADINASTNPAPDKVVPTDTDTAEPAEWVLPEPNPATGNPAAAPVQPTTSTVLELQPGAPLLQGNAASAKVEPNAVFLTEADTLSQQLQSDIAAWAVDADAPLPSQTAEQSRALTRSAWDAGCTDISLLTHTLQMVLDRLRTHATLAQRQACVQACDEVLRLLHQFAAGFMRRPHPQVLDALNRILADTASAPDAVPAAAFSDVQDEASEPQPLSTTSEAADLTPTPASAINNAVQSANHGSAESKAPLAVQAPSVDRLEPVRFAVFEEEVLTVWPALQTALQQWMAEPAKQGPARQTLLRSLHTLKGSARLAGAAAWASQVHALEDLALLAQPNAGPLGPSALQQPLEVLRIGFVALQQEMATRHPERAVQHWGNSPIDTVGRHGQALWSVHEQTTQSMSENQQTLAEMDSCLQRLRAQLKDCAAWADTLVLYGDMDLSYEWHEELHDLIRNLGDCTDDMGTVQRQLQHGLATADTALTTQAGHLRALQHTLLYARLVPLAQLHDRLLATVQLAASDTGKPTQLILQGADQLMERRVTEQLTPALEHLLRNCVDHGIESAALREASGKPAQGSVTLELKTQGSTQTLTLRDDGAGLPIERVRAKAISLGLLQEGEAVDAQRAAELILHPGLSTAAHITELSGRGIGMDAVQASVQALGGQLHIDSAPGQGCSFVITLPAPPQVEQVVALRAGSWSLALPARSIEAVRRIPSAQMDQAIAQGTLPDDVTGPMPLYWAGAVWQQSARSSAAPVDGQSIALVVRSDTSRWALQVDEVLGTQEVALQAPTDIAVPLPGLLGTAAQPSGQVLQVYDPYAALAAHEARRMPQTASPTPAQAEAVEDDVATRPLVLIADDSISVRRLAQHLLQTNGYRVETAPDGLQAWQQLQTGEQPALLLADVEMPEMDGLELLRRVRAHPRCKQLPVVVLTAHEAGPVSQKAIDAGAQAFLTKPYAPNELLALVRRCARVPEVIEAVEVQPLAAEPINA